MIHYHGTPISPVSELLTLAGRHFCVSHAHPADVRRAHEIGQGVLLDNGAFSKFQSGKKTDWDKYYKWVDPWLDYPTTWAVIPDVIDAGTQEQDALIREWPHGQRGAPVWHMDEPIERLLRLLDTWPRVCIGSTAEYWRVMSPTWQQRMDEVWENIVARHRRTPWVHMFRGMQLSGERWPFASVDSTDVAQNHHLPHKTALKMAARWDAIQCPGRYTATVRPQQAELPRA